MKRSIYIIVVSGIALLTVFSAAIAGNIMPTERGAVVETERYRAEFRNGVLTGFFNKLTAEEYVRQDVKAAEVIPHLPSGLATQSTKTELEAAANLFEYYWSEQPATNIWPNQHVVDAQSVFACETNISDSVVLNYKGLSSGSERFPEETFSLTLRIDPEHGDLLVTPAATSPRGGVYGVSLSSLPLAKDVTVEAPIFDGLRLDTNQDTMLWQQVWGSYWDYGFVALNGKTTGAVGWWCQDAELKTYKAMYYLINEEGLSLSLQALNTPPFNELKQVSPITWRLQAFDKSWSQAAKRFRTWRQKNVKIAPRPEWVNEISFMQYGGKHASPEAINWQSKYFEGEDLDRIIAWFPDVRAAGFDKNHSNNTPYDGFKEDMQVWKEKDMKNMTYLQPMIMWGPQPKTAREKQAVEFSKEAMTRQAFYTNNFSITKHSQHNLGCPRWQRWFLDWVKEYIQDYGTTGIYHDQSYACMIDVRGKSAPGGKTTTEGMADYFYKAATENPDSIHGTEHLTEVNSVGATLGLGSGIIWGTPGYRGKIGPVGSMNWQRIKKASPVSNALHAPQSRIAGFPHQSDYASYNGIRFHQGMDLMERRGDLPALDWGGYSFWMKQTPVELYANEIWLDRQRALSFVRNGLKPDFPEDWDRNVLTYFKGKKGEDYRYEQMTGGTCFAEYQKNKRRLIYARISGVNRLPMTEGTILGWPCYEKNGLSGLNPGDDVTYVIQGGLTRPEAWFELPGDDLCLVDGYSSKDFAFIQLKPIPGRPLKTQSITLHAQSEPKGLWVDGVRIKPESKSSNSWTFQIKENSYVIALLSDAPTLTKTMTEPMALCRIVDTTSYRDQLRPDGLTDCIVPDKDGLRINVPGGKAANLLKGQPQIHLALRAPADSNGVLRLVGKFRKNRKSEPAYRLNGKPITFKIQEKGSVQVLDIPLKANENAILSMVPAPIGQLTLEWISP
jgi:hypothetical protein